MDTIFKDIAIALEGGPKPNQSDQSRMVFMHIFDVVLSLTTQEEALEQFSEDFLSTLIKYTGVNSPYNEIIFNIFINITSSDIISKRLFACKDMGALLKLSIENITDKTCKNADVCCMFLSNITRFEKNCELITESMAPFTDTLNRLVAAFTTIGYNSICSLDQLAMLFCNLSQLAKVRNVITETDRSILQKLIPFINHSNSIRRNGIVGVIHNCVFDTSIHSWLLGDEIDVLPRLLLPLAGSEQFDDEDNDKLPIDLQFLPETKVREPNPEIRKQLLETLNQLCATKFGRQFLRDHNTYVILRELHKWEKDSAALFTCENVVDILIRTEEEIGIDHLKSVDIPEDLEEKFNKVLNSSQ